MPNLILAVLIVLLTACAGTKTVSKSSATSESAPDPIYVVERGRVIDDSEMICHWEAKTGTRLQKKVCLTRAERALLAEESQKFLKEIQHRATIAPNR